MAPETVVVIGAGIVGMSAAIWLQRAGRNVVVVDKGLPGMGTSYGNGGIIVPCGVAPVTAPGMLMKAPGYLMNPNFPLFMRWSYLPSLVPWLLRYMSHANIKNTRRIAKGLTPIVGDSVAQHKALAKGTAAAGWITDSDYCFAFKDRAAFETDPFTWELRREAGFIPEFVEGGAVQEFEPALGDKTGFLAVMKDHAFVRAPGKYVQALADVFIAGGGDLRQVEVNDLTLTDGKVTSVVTSAGNIPCNKAVIATGVWSKPLMKKLGLNIPLESERGYHIVFKDPSIKLNATYMITSGKFVATPMQEGLRVAGVVEFGGLEAGPSKAPIELLYRQVKQNFPTLTYSEAEEWQGHRPALTDSLPIIGEIAGSGVYAGFGHHHIGLTGGPKTGRLIADLISQKGTNLDLSAYDPGRFN
ncbi:MAG: FAD-dependent oxidoreductase [Rhodobacteraceae bacterium]|nr:FAD-dependent oxidoreductase [Paracoccaceae bacterium]